MNPNSIPTWKDYQEQEQDEILTEQQRLVRDEAHPYIRDRQDYLLHNELVVLSRAVYFEELSPVSITRHLKGVLGEKIYSNPHVQLTINPPTFSLIAEITRHYINLVRGQMEEPSGN